MARSGIASIIDLQRELEEAAQEIAEAEDEADRDRATRRYDDCTTGSSTRTPTRSTTASRRCSAGLGFARADFHAPARTFSGGQQSRLMLAKLLLETPDLMLLDEPSNHLDIETTAWLENYLARQAVAMVVVSHDRYFLDKVVTRIWELHEGKVEAYPGNYSPVLAAADREGQGARPPGRAAGREDRRPRSLHPQVWRGAAGQAGPRPREEAGADRAGRDDARDRRPRMGFGEVDRAGDIVIEARKLSKAYDTPLFQDFNLHGPPRPVRRRDGAQRVGQDDLIKTLIGREKPDSGEAKLGHKVQVGYHDQGLESLAPETTVVRAVWPEDDPDWVQGDVRDLLARFGLSGEIVFQTVGQLSGGEKAKAALARLSATGANLLVMDEPTNHLDIWSCDALERSIREFEGTVLVVSHDRYFLNQVADRLIVVSGGRARVIEGDYETYQRFAQQEAERRAGQGRGPRRGSRDARRWPTEGGPAEAKVPLPQDGRAGARDRRHRRTGRRARRPPRSARHLARPGQGRHHPGPPQGAQGDARAALRALGRGRRAQLVRPMGGKARNPKSRMSCFVPDAFGQHSSTSVVSGFPGRNRPLEWRQSRVGRAIVPCRHRTSSPTHPCPTPRKSSASSSAPPVASVRLAAAGAE